MKKYLLAGLLSVASTGALANDWYIGANYSVLDIDLDVGATSYDADTTAINAKLGYMFNDNFAVETTLGLGVSDGQIGNFEADFEVDNIFTVSAVGIIPLSEKFSLYGKAGLAQLSYDDNYLGDADASGLMLGAGASLDFTERFGMSLEYTLYPEGEYDDYPIDVEAKALSLGVHFRF